MSSSVTIAELMVTFRMGLLALIPVAERSGIAWNGSTVYDPWENIECALFNSLVESATESAVDSPFPPMPRYGAAKVVCRCQLPHRPIGSAQQGSFGFLKLATATEPFDTASFIIVDAAFGSGGQTLDIPLDDAKFAFAVRAADAIRYRDVIRYAD